MFKYLNPKRFYYAVGKKKFLEFILLAVFMLFFYGPLMYMCITAFGNVYEVPNIFPTEWGFKWWNFVFSQKSLVSSIVQSLTIAVITRFQRQRRSQSGLSGGIELPALRHWWSEHA